MTVQEARKLLLQIKKDEEKRKDVFTVVFCGVFSSGKSSLLNYLLGYEDFLPVGINPVTKIVTKIQYGDTPRFFLSGERKRDEIDKVQFASFVTAKKKIPKYCKEIIIELPAEILKDGVVFMDTPGISDEAELDAISKQAMLRGDMAVICTSAVQLGTMDEKSLLNELDERLGNYCMVVNKLDLLNTKEDMRDMQQNAMRLMDGRGGDICKNLMGRTCFFTVAGGDYKNIDGFDSFLSYIASATSIKNDLKQSSTIITRRHRRQKVYEECMIEESQEVDKLAEIQRLHDEKIQKLDHENKQRKMEIELRRGELRRRYESEIDDAAGIVENKMNDLKNKGVTDGFQKQSRKCLEESFAVVAERTDAELPDGYSLKEIFENNIEKFEIPKPERMRVKKRGLLDRVINTVDNIRYGIYEVDDGCDYVYGDYQKPAIQAVRNNLTVTLKAVLNSTIDSAYSIPDEPLVSGFEGRIAEQEKLVSTWKELLDDIQSEMKQ